jgi:hypothetical protein
MEKEDYEKIARLETQIDNLTNIVMRMDAKLDTWQENYVPRKEIYEMFRARDKELADLSERVDKHIDDSNTESKSFKNNLPNWIGIIFGFISLLIMVYELSK